MSKKPFVVRVALVGDYDSTVIAHQAIPEALRLSAQTIGCELTTTWVPTPRVGAPGVEPLSDFAAIWCVPASPYASMNGALTAIGFAREAGYPFLGTCAGFQHAVIEYVRHVLGRVEADHAETSPDTQMPIISRLTCSMVEKAGTVNFRKGSKLREIYGVDQFEEMYHCNFGVNPAYAHWLENESGLRASAYDSAGEVRAVELVGHTFFLGTAYQPERWGLRGIVHPLVTAFVAAAADRIRVLNDSTNVDRARLVPR